MHLIRAIAFNHLVEGDLEVGTNGLCDGHHLFLGSYGLISSYSVRWGRISQ